MSPLYLYALAGVEPDPALPLGEGIGGEPLSTVRCGRLFALVGSFAAGAPRPALTAAALARQDETVRRLADRVPALLPARFGEWLPDARLLAESLAPRSGEIARALILVEGCVQMTLRVFGEPGEPGEPDVTPVLEEPAGPGTRYLAARRRAANPGLPEVAALRAALRPLLRAERIERHEKGQLLATAHDLVRREEAGDYRQIVEDAAGALAGRKVTVSGPWPPYAFAPGVGDIGDIENVGDRGGAA
jgi:hypothetical protein